MTTPNFDNQTIWTGDNLDVLRGINSGCVDLIYLDPPFNSNADYAAPIGSQAAGAEFRDTWGLDDIDVLWHALIRDRYPALYSMLEAVKLVHSDSMMSYLIYMTPRLMELRRVLKPAGSIYLHCDPTASHYLKLVMDAVFGRQNFRNEIIWGYSSASNVKKHFPKKHDTILFYARSPETEFNRDAVRIPYSLNSKKAEGSKTIPTSTMPYSKVKLNKGGKVPESWWTDITSIFRYKKELGQATLRKSLSSCWKGLLLPAATRRTLSLTPFVDAQQPV